MSEIKEYLEKCPKPSSEDEGEKILYELVNALGVDSSFKHHIRILAATLVAATGRVDDPPCPWKYLLVLDGPVGVGKSAAIQTLCPLIDEVRAKYHKISVEKQRDNFSPELPQRLIQVPDGGPRFALPIYKHPIEGVFIAIAHDKRYLRDSSVREGANSLQVVELPMRNGAVCDLRWIDQNRDRVWGASYMHWNRKGLDRDECVRRLHEFVSAESPYASWVSSFWYRKKEQS